MTIQRRLLAAPALLACLASAAFGQVLVDVDFAESTAPADADLVIVRERGIGAAGVDLTAYGIAGGPHGHVQSLYVRLRHGDAGATLGVRGRLVLPPSVTILGIIKDGDDLGGDGDDGVYTETDALFAIAGREDEYSAPRRGVELADSEHVCVRSGNVVDFQLVAKQDDLDDFRVVVDHGASFPAAVTCEVELTQDESFGHLEHVAGIRVGDAAGAVEGSGDPGEVPGLSGLPLTAGAAPVAPSPGIDLDPVGAIFLSRSGGGIGGDHLELFEPQRELVHGLARRGTGREITRGPDGFVYARALNFRGFYVIDPVTGNLGKRPVPGASVPLDVAGYEGGDELVFARESVVEIVDAGSATVVATHPIAAGDLFVLTGVAWEGGDIVLAGGTTLGGNSGGFLVMDPNTGSYTVHPVPGTPSYLDVELSASGAEAYLLRQMPGSGHPIIDVYDMASGALALDAMTCNDRTPRELTRDASGHLWVLTHGFFLGDHPPLARFDPASRTYLGSVPCGAVYGSWSIVGDVNPAPLGRTFCSHAVENRHGGRGWLIASGSTAVADRDLTLTALDLNRNAFGFVISSLSTGFTPMAGGGIGTLCLGGAVGRHDAQIMNGGFEGTFSVAIDLTSFPTPSGAVSIAAGDTWYFQCWHRDQVGTSATFNFTSALELTFH